MNRLVLIGNGFDLAHGLKTSYADFVNWYWQQRIEKLASEGSRTSDDGLCSFEMKVQAVWGYLISFTNKETKAEDAIRYMENQGWCSIHKHSLLARITTSIETKGWVDIENEYYELLKQCAFPHPGIYVQEPSIEALNKQLRKLQELLVEYLTEVYSKKPNKIKNIETAIYSPLVKEDMSIAGVKEWEEHLSYWKETTIKDDGPIEEKIDKFGWDYGRSMRRINIWKKAPKLSTIPEAFYLPNDIMFLNFNYTDTVQLYIKPQYQNQGNHIHGEISNPNSIIFGYGDELDDKFKELKAHKNNACLSNVKSIRYLETPNYRKVLSFIESEPFQVLIMGHSCGNSDRTLLNTIFEHKNCVSIKPYYYQKEDGTDNYIEIVQNISRNFTDMKLMRDRVVNKTQCEPLVKE